MKLSGQPSKSQIIWAGRQVLATASGENVVRYLGEIFNIIINQQVITLQSNYSEKATYSTSVVIYSCTWLFYDSIKLTVLYVFIIL